MVNYNNGKVYKIEAINGKPEDIYIGSTTLLLCKRMAHHRSNESTCNSKILFEKYGVKNCKIVLIENVNVKTKEELLQREAFYIKSLQCINKSIPLRTYKEYYEENKINILKSNLERYYKNHEENLLKNRESQAISRKLDLSVKCLCGGSYNNHCKKEHLSTKKHQKFINNIV